MKRLILLASLSVLFTPFMAKAHDWGNGNNDRDDRHHHRKIGASEMAAVGLAGAAVIGVAGYLVLRRRNAS